MRVRKYAVKNFLSEKNNDKKKMKNKKVMVRTISAGVFAGILKSRKGSEVTMENARRVYFWTGAATLSQLSQDGSSSPETCKFPAAVPKITLLGVIEIIPMTPKAVASINSVKIWSE